MNKLALMTTAALMTAGAAFANSQADIVDILKDQGYESVDVTRSGNTVTFEAMQGDQMRELVYNASTGTLLEDTVTITTTGETMLFPAPANPSREIGDLTAEDDNVVIRDTAADQPELGVEIDEGSGIAMDDLNDEAGTPSF
ncbi:MAG: hypothetical protein AAFR93_08300 [Pseudomonadota bacterium]